jgi:hypothetical protein
MHIIYLLFIFAVLLQSCDSQILVIFELFRARPITTFTERGHNESESVVNGGWMPLRICAEETLTRSTHLFRRYNDEVSQILGNYNSTT